MSLLEEEKRQAFDVNTRLFEKMKSDFTYLLKRFDREARYESFTRFNVPTLPMRLREEFWTTSFFTRLDNLYDRFLALEPEYGVDCETYADTMRPIQDEYVKLREEFSDNLLV